MRSLRFAVLAALAAAFAAGPAAAHDFWVQPARFQAPPQATLPLTLQVGHGPQRQRSPIALRRIVRFDAVGPGGIALDLRGGLHPGGGGEDGQIRLPAAGTFVVVLQTDDHAQSRLPALRFNDYLQAEGLTPALEARRRTNRTQADGAERYSRCAKVLVQAGAGGASRATQAIGLPLEIVPEADPYAANRSARLPVRVLYHGRPLAGALVKLTDLAHDAEPVAVQRTDSSGHAAFAMPNHGDWLINVVWTRALPATDEVDFETVFSSLAFGLPGAAIAKESDSGVASARGAPSLARRRGMRASTCAACDCELEAVVIVVTVRGQRVEVCCQSCAQALGEAQAAAEAEARPGDVARRTGPHGGASHILSGEARRPKPAAGPRAG